MRLSVILFKIGPMATRSLLILVTAHAFLFLFKPRFAVWKQNSSHCDVNLLDCLCLAFDWIMSGSCTADPPLIALSEVVGHHKQGNCR